MLFAFPIRWLWGICAGDVYGTPYPDGVDKLSAGGDEQRATEN